MINLIENFFNIQECNYATDEINQNNSLRYKCDETDMYILGNSFLRNQNNYLKNNDDFKTVELFKEKLSTMFPKVEFCTNLGKPGFQIIKKNDTNKPCVWHYDSILVCFPYQNEFSDYNNNFNEYFDEYYIFTLMLSDSQASFDYFPETTSNFGNSAMEETETPICKDHVDLIGDNCGNPDCRLIKFNTINYTQGSLLVQNERMLHRVGHRDIDGTDSNRIALQGYGVIKDNVMYLCW